MRRGLALSLSACLLACGVDREPSKSATKREPAADAKPAVEVRAKTPAPAEPPRVERRVEKRVEKPADPMFDSLLGGRFALAAAGLEHSTMDAREHGPKWQPPACELEYQFRVRIGDGNRDPELGMATVISGSWKARAGEPGMVLKNGEIRLVNIRGQHAAGTVERVLPGKLAEVRLAHVHHEWREDDGPTALWSAYGSWTGLHKFHPGLPELGAAGSAAIWHMNVHERRSSAVVEARRGSLEVPDGVVLPEAEELNVRNFRNPEVSVERWIEIGDAAAVVLRSWEELDDRNSKSAPRDDHRREISQGRFVVLDSGVLLHAELRERTEFFEMQTQIEIDAEARLVRGCGGPVLPRMSDMPSGSELAIDAVAQLRGWAQAGGHAQLYKRMDEALVASEPKAAQCLINAIERFGVESFGAPKLPLGQAVSERDHRVELELPARTSPDDRSGSARYVFAIDADSRVPTLSAIELRRGAERLLLLTPDQPTVAVAGCEAPVDR